MSEENLAMKASRASWACVKAHDKEGWLALMHDDIRIEDPIGQGLTNPDGEGIRGKAAVSEFYDKNIGPAQIEVEPHESFLAASPQEAAHVLTIHTTLPNGVVTRVRGIFTYRTDPAGLLTNLRGFWHMGVMRFEQPEAG
ncbi:MAG: nuclear transport factor 2 family protein [Myxococcota bacterium]